MLKTTAESNIYLSMHIPIGNICLNSATDRHEARPVNNLY
jgi:hypothetical protein